MMATKRSYISCERDALEVIFALRKFSVYLLLTVQFTLIKDHDALRYAFHMKDIHCRLARSMDFLAEFYLTIKQMKGKANLVPDFLFRIEGKHSRAEEVDGRNLFNIIEAVGDENE